MLVTLLSSASIAVAIASQGVGTVPDDLDRLISVALDDSDTTQAAWATAALRDRGQPAVDALIAKRDALASSEAIPFDIGMLGLNAAIETSVARDRHNALIDAVARQQHASASGLFWYTDFAAAKAEAKRTGKPIVSLRLLGQLDEDLSCANSRYFRTTLYPNALVAKDLRDQFVLHWQPVRDSVPKITIDFGEGRTIERTITGNSFHWMLDADGRPVDALPGLVGAGHFRDWLKHAGAMAKTVAQLDGDERRAAMSVGHQARLVEMRARWARDLKAVGVEVADDRLETLRAATTDEVLERLATQRFASAQLDGAATAVVTSTFPPAERAMPLAVSKSFVETPMLRAIRNLHTTIRRDEVQNDYVFHSQIHTWLAEAAPTEPAATTRRIYAELFKSPVDDPFMGLAMPDRYSAIAGGDVVRGDGVQ